MAKERIERRYVEARIKKEQLDALTIMARKLGVKTYELTKLALEIAIDPQNENYFRTLLDKQNK